MEWTFNTGVIQHYFPNVEIGKLTLDNYWSRLKMVKKLLGQDDEDKTEQKSYTPDEWFQKAMNGDIAHEDMGLDASPLNEKDSLKAKQVLELQKLGFM